VHPCPTVLATNDCLVREKNERDRDKEALPPHWHRARAMIHPNEAIIGYGGVEHAIWRASTRTGLERCLTLSIFSLQPRGLNYKASQVPGFLPSDLLCLDLVLHCRRICRLSGGTGRSGRCENVQTRSPEYTLHRSEDGSDSYITAAYTFLGGVGSIGTP
jgi:hypothetical protein